MYSLLEEIAITERDFVVSRQQCKSLEFKLDRADELKSALLKKRLIKQRLTDLYSEIEEMAEQEREPVVKKEVYMPTIELKKHG